MFLRNKEYRESLLTQHNELSTRKMQLEKTAREAASAGNQVEYLRDQITELRAERDRLQSQMDAVLQNPFFKKEHDESNLQTITDLETKLNHSEIEFKKARNNIERHEEDIKETNEKYRDLGRERKHYDEDLEKLKAFNDPSGLSVEQI